MRQLRIVARTIAGVSGPIIGLVWGAISFVQEKRPMSPLEWIGLVLLSASIAYGIAELVIFLRGLHKKIEALREKINALRALGIETRLARMERWWIAPEDNLDLYSLRALSSEKKS